MAENQLIKIAIFAIALIALMYVISLYNKKQNLNTNEEGENFENESNEDEVSNSQLKETSSEIQASESLGNNEVYQEINVNDETGKFGLSGNQFPNDCFPKDQLTPGELLPGDANSKWAQSVPAGQGELGDQNFLTSGHHIGVNTVGQTLRNANRQIRSEPPNPQVKVSPWLQTTIEADTNRRALEIGGCE